MSLCHYVKFRYLKNTSQKLTAELELSIIKNIFLQRVCRVLCKIKLEKYYNPSSNFYKTWWGFRWMNIHLVLVLKKNNPTILTMHRIFYENYVYYVNTEKTKYRISCLQSHWKVKSLLADKFKFVLPLTVSKNKCKLLILEAIFVRISAIHPFPIRCRRLFVGATKHSQNYQHFMITGIHQEC